MPKSQSLAPAASGQKRKATAKPASRGRAPGQPKEKSARAGVVADYAARLPMYAKCSLNPFDEPPCGYPDVFNKPTLKVKLVESYILTSDATGYVARIVGTSLVRSIYTSTTTAGLFVDGTYAAHPDYSSVTANSAWARTVCLGVSIDYIGAGMTAAGTLMVTTDPTVNYWTGSTPESCMDDGDTGPALEGRKISVIPSMPPRYDLDTGAAFMSPTFDYVYVLATGLPASTACLRMTVVRHLEMLPAKNNTVGRGSATHTTAEPAALVALSGVEKVSGSQRSWKQELGSASKSAAAALWAAVKPELASAGKAALGIGMAALTL